MVHLGRVELTLEEYAALLGSSGMVVEGRIMKGKKPKIKRTSRKVSAYNKRYRTAFKRIAPKNRKKNGGWKQGGFVRTAKAAHKAAKRK